MSSGHSEVNQQTGQMSEEVVQLGAGTALLLLPHTAAVFDRENRSEFVCV